MSLLQDTIIVFGRAVVERSKPTVPWGVPCAVVAVDEAVMQLVEKITQGQLSYQNAYVQTQRG